MFRAPRRIRVTRTLATMSPARIDGPARRPAPSCLRACLSCVCAPPTHRALLCRHRASTVHQFVAVRHRHAAPSRSHAPRCRPPARRSRGPARVERRHAVVCIRPALPKRGRARLLHSSAAVIGWPFPGVCPPAGTYLRHLDGAGRTAARVPSAPPDRPLRAAVAGAGLEFTHCRKTGSGCTGSAGSSGTSRPIATTPGSPTPAPASWPGSAKPTRPSPLIEGLLAGPSLLSVHELRVNPEFDPIRSDPRYRAMLGKYAGRRT